MSDFADLDEAWLRSRRGIKWAVAPPDELPAWVADMDFPPPDVVTVALREEIDRADHGYPDLRGGSRLAPLFVERMRSRHAVTLHPDRVREFNDVLNAVQALLFTSTRPGDGIAFHAPTYPPFLEAFEKLGLSANPIPMYVDDGTWVFDPEAAERAIARSRALLIVNPHNPTGRVLGRPELESMTAAARRHGSLIVSDEVHADLVFEGRSHLPTAAVAPETATIYSATKSFNLAGIRCALAHVGSDEMWDGLNRRPEHLFGAVANLSVTATRAAWESGDPWLQDLMDVLSHNRAEIGRRVPHEFLPGLPEATYLAWLDLRGTDLGDEPAGEIRRRSGLRLSEGAAFGDHGRGFARLNFATSPSILGEALNRLLTSIA